MSSKSIFTILSCTLAMIMGGCTTSARRQTAHPRPQVLVIGHASALRDVVDLKPVVPDFAWHTAPVAGCITDGKAQNIAQHSFYWVDFARSTDKVERDLLASLAQHPDVIVLTIRPTWHNYPAAVRQEILNQVQNGAVLALFGDHEEFLSTTRAQLHSIALANRFASLGARDRFKFTAYTYGRGKVIIQPKYVDFRGGFVAPELQDAGEFHYYMARFGQLLRTALAGKVEIPPTAGTKLYNAAGQIVTQLDKQPAGRYFELQYYRDAAGNAVEISGKSVQVEREVQLVKLERLNPVACHRNDTLQLQAQWSKTTQDGITILTLRDANGRIYVRQEYAGTPEKFQIVIPGKSTSIYNEVQVDYYQNDRHFTFGKTFFTLPELRQRLPFYFLAWGRSWNSVRQDAYLQLLKAQGIDGITNFNPTATILQQFSRLGLQSVPYTAAFHKSSIPWLMHDYAAGQRLKKARKAAELGKTYGILAHSLGDENYVSAFQPDGVFWDHPLFWSKFQAYLKQHYASIAELNAQWQTKFPAFEKIYFANEQALFDYQCPARWVAYRNFISQLFIGEQLKLAQAIKAVDPGVLVGWEGGEQYSSYDGYDLYPYVAQFDMANVYARNFMDKMLPNKIFNGHCMRSFAPQGALLGLWMNGTAFPNELYLTPYVALFSGMRSIWWWHAVFPEEECTVLRHDLTPGIPFSQTAQAVREIKQGPAALLDHAVPETPEIAIYYSAANFHASSLSARLGNHVNNLGRNEVQWNQCPALKMGDRFAEQRAMWAHGKAAGHYNVAFKSFITLIKDLNLDARVIDRRQIEQGGLTKYRLLILPFVEALSDKEVQEIKTFVRNGGAVVADYRTGIRTEMCNFRAQGALDEVFGIAQTAPYEATFRREHTVVETCMVDGRLSFELPISFSQPQLKLQGGTAWGLTDSGVPSYIFHNYGRGKALFMNCDFYQYFDLRRKKMEFDLTNYWRELLIRHLNFPLWSPVRSLDHVPLRTTSVFRFQENEAHYIGIIPDRLLQENAATISAVVPLNAPGHIYNVLTQEYLGCGTTAQLKLTRGRPALLAVFKEKVTVPEVTGSRQVAAGETAQFQLNAGPGTHTLRLKVFAPDGRECPHYGSFQHLSNHAVTCAIPTALNDPRGKWRLEVTEVASGLTTNYCWKLTDN